MATTLSLHGNYLVEEVTFESSRLQLVGTLHLPSAATEPRAAVVVLGPFASVKEHAPVQYATRLADEGYIALVFDCSHHGESAGEPRPLEDPFRKIADVRAAIDYLVARPEVNPLRIAAVGLGDGAAELLRLAVDDHRIRAIAAVAGFYRDHGNDLVRALANEQADEDPFKLEAETRLGARRDRAAAALIRYERTGEVDYLPITDANRSDVALPGKAAWESSGSCAGKGLWENRYAIMGDLAYLDFESLSAAAATTTPTLMLHGDRCEGVASARRHFEVITDAPKELVWENETSHSQYCDDPAAIDRATARVERWFRDHL
jgi:hypothetical protein